MMTAAYDLTLEELTEAVRLYLNRDYNMKMTGVSEWHIPALQKGNSSDIAVTIRVEVAPVPAKSPNYQGPPV